MRAMKPTSNPWSVCSTRRRTRARRDRQTTGRPSRLGPRAPRCTPRAVTPGLHDEAPTRVRVIACPINAMCAKGRYATAAGDVVRMRLNRALEATTGNALRGTGCARRMCRAAQTRQGQSTPDAGASSIPVCDPAEHPPRRPSRKCPTVPRAGAVHARRPRRRRGQARYRARTRVVPHCRNALAR